MVEKTCAIPIFDFHLDDIEDCDVIKEREKRTISWYTLTCGYYRIVLGDNFLLNYSDQVVDKWKVNGNIPDKYFPRRLHENYSSYVDYYVSRLWEDLIDMLPVIREPLPQKLEIIMNDPRRWHNKAQKWIDNQPDNDKYWDIYCAGTSWLDSRQLDNGYLSPSSPIYIYLSKDNMVHFVWDNRNKKIENIAAWSSESGRFCLSKDVFFQEVALFNHRLLDLMKRRIEWVIKNYGHQEKYINLEYLREEHKANEGCLLNKLKQPLNNENFGKILEAIEKMNISC
ncbi:MAG: hypothetical protein K0R76_783 [Alphaproteobacteria bacterium]|jgi:hypothetical protein|nr:hypothetical protein [Alphaproteobacteria bacterium]